MVISVATEKAKVYTQSALRKEGSYTKMSQAEYHQVLARFAAAQAWTAELITNNLSCRALIFVISGAGGITHQGFFTWPFQS